MKRLKTVLKWLAIVAAVIALSLGAFIYSVFGGLAPIADGVEPAPGVRIVKAGFVSFGVIDVGNGQLALIDAGNDPAGKEVLAEIHRRNLNEDAVRAIFFTHGHRDHTGAAPLFPKAETYILEADVALAEGRAGGHGPVTKLFPVKPTGITITHPVHDEETIHVGDKDVRVFAVPGHTMGSAAYLVSGVLFLGDSGGHTTGDTLRGAPWALSDDSEKNHASLKALADRLRPEKASVVAVVPAHSGAGTFDILDNYRP